jgi:nucleoside-diphosphate-sugar epimerase
VTTRKSTTPCDADRAAAGQGRDFLRELSGARVLVTGGTGFIGRHVLHQAVRGELDVYSLSIRMGDVPGVRYVQADLQDREQVFRIIDDLRPAGVIHLAAAGVSSGTDQMASMLYKNVLGTENLFAALSSVGLSSAVVMAGSGAEYAPQNRAVSESDSVAPISSYGVTKAAAALCAGWYARHVPVTLLRLFNVYGPGEKTPRLVPYIIERTKAGEPIELTACEQVRDFVHASDVAESFWRALCHPPQNQRLLVLNVGSGRPLRLRDFVETLTAILREENLEPEIVFGARPYRPDEPMTYAADITRLRQYLGWTPGIGIDKGLRQTVRSTLASVPS